MKVKELVTAVHLRTFWMMSGIISTREHLLIQLVWQATGWLRNTNIKASY